MVKALMLWRSRALKHERCYDEMVRAGMPCRRDAPENEGRYSGLGMDALVIGSTRNERLLPNGVRVSVLRVACCSGFRV